MPTDMHQLPREEFIERNLGLVHACAGRFKGRGIEYEELYAAGLFCFFQNRSGKLPQCLL